MPLKTKPEGNPMLPVTHHGWTVKVEQSPYYGYFVTLTKDDEEKRPYRVFETPRAALEYGKQRAEELAK